MKSKILLSAAASCLIFLNSCDIEMVPKGMTTIETTEELNMLLNKANFKQCMPWNDLSIICNESYGEDWNGTVATRAVNSDIIDAAYLGYNETIDRASMTSKDDRYDELYSLINVRNVVESKADDCEGTPEEKARLKAESRLQRAYFHFLAAVIYAPQYDAATAAQKGGIAYVVSTNTAEQKTQLNLEQTYAKILGDLRDEDIELMPNTTNVVRLTKGAGYAIKARVLYQMKRYSEALTYANKALGHNSTIEDRTYVVNSHLWAIKADAPNNYWYISPMSFSYPVRYEQLSLETIKLFEEGDILKNYAYYGGSPARGPLYSFDYGAYDSGVQGVCELMPGDHYINSWGLNVERMMYVAAECYIRTGEIQKGLDLINKVRKCRIHPEKYVPLTASNEKEAMEKFQPVKFIENLATFENFFDIKRWNSEEAYKRTITKTIPKAGTFTITPDSPLWIFPFSVNVMNYNTSFKQNY